jgi:hypothetical protein
LFGWLVFTLLGTVGVTIACRRLLPRVLVWFTFVACASAIAGMVILQFGPHSGGAVPQTARLCAALALVWSLFGAGLQWRERRRAAKSLSQKVWHGVATRGLHRLKTDAPVVELSGGLSLLRVVHVVALLLGVVAAIVHSVILVMRLILVGIDLLQCVPWHPIQSFGFSAQGLWTVGLLLCACTVSLLSTRDRRLVTCLFWIAALMSSWACLLLPALRSNPMGGYQRTGITLALLTDLSVLIVVTSMISALAERRRRALIGPSPPSDPPDMRASWPGLHSSVAVVGAGVILLVCYQLAVPIPFGTGGFRFTAGIVGAAAAAGALASFRLLARGWSAPLADAAMGLTSVSLCGMATVAVPSHPASLAERYPMTFNAMMLGLAVGAMLWTWLASVWERRGDGKTAAHRLASHAKHFAFLNAALALMVGVLMAVWPRWPGIAATDDSLGRVIAGFSAHLFLLLATLWCSRRLHRLPLQILTVLTVLAAAGFLLVRAIPFTSSFS